MAETNSYRVQIERAPETERWGAADAFGGLIVAYLLTNIVGAFIASAYGWKSVADIPMWGFGVIQIPLWAGYVGATVVAARKGSGLARSFGVVVRRFDAPIGLAVGVVCQLLVLPALYVPIFHLTQTDSKELSRPAKQLAENAQSQWGWVLFAVLVGLVAPVVEEIFFRGLMLRSFSKLGLPVWAAVALSSVIFAGLHFQLLQLPGLFLFGIAAAVLAVVTGRLGPAMFAHIGFNATTVVVLYLEYRTQTG